MKGDKLLIIGGLVAAGVVAYEIYMHFNSAKSTCRATSPNVDDNKCPAQVANPHTDPCVASVAEVYEAKEAAVGTVKERHYEAAKVLEESLNTIFKEDEDEDLATENSEVLDRTSSDLDDLLK